MDRKRLDKLLKYILLTLFFLYTVFFLILVPRFFQWWRLFQIYSPIDDLSGIYQLIRFITILLIPFIPFFLNWFFCRIRERNRVLPIIFYATVIITLLALAFIIVYVTTASAYFPKMHCEPGLDGFDVCRYGWYRN